MYPFAKRAFDIALSMFGIVVASPLLGAIAIAIRRESPGPILYRGPRVARGGGMFQMLKFRTMVVNADKIGGSSTPDDDPRITKTGKFLRATKLDELPQLFNVLKGDMSFVGPRPQVKWAVDLYTPEQRELLKLRPGITDFASLNFPNEGEILKGSLDPDKDYMEKIHPEKMRLSLQYQKQASLWLDIKIIFKTLGAVFA